MAFDEMSINERLTYLSKMLPMYLKADRAHRGELLTRMQAVTGMARKSLTRLLKSQSQHRKKRTFPRKRSYGLDVERVVGVVWEGLDYVCVERLKPGPPLTAGTFSASGNSRLLPSWSSSWLTSASQPYSG